jgi:hypothetical protein
MITDIAKRKQVMVGRAQVVAEYLHEKGVTAVLENLELHGLGFTLETSQTTKQLDGILEDLFQKWDDCRGTQINRMPGGGKILVLDFGCSHPEHQGP